MYLSMASVQKAVKKKNKNRAKNAGQDSTFRGKPVSTKWKPVWGWLHSLDRTEVVEGAEILEWLNLNAQYAAWLRTQHSNCVLVSYIQKCHHRLLFGREYHKSEEKKVRHYRNLFLRSFLFWKTLCHFFCTKILFFQMLLVQDGIRVLVQRESI